MEQTTIKHYETPTAELLYIKQENILAGSNEVADEDDLPID